MKKLHVIIDLLGVLAAVSVFLWLFADLPLWANVDGSTFSGFMRAYLLVIAHGVALAAPLIRRGVM